MAYLRAVVAVYGPWTESKVISLEERKRAQARVYEARLALRRLKGEYRPTRVSGEPGGGNA